MERQRPPLQDGGIARVTHENPCRHAEGAEQKHVKEVRAADEELQGVGHDAPIGRDRDDVRYEEQRDAHVQNQLEFGDDLSRATFWSIEA